jgi:hypothetical protein
MGLYKRKETVRRGWLAREGRMVSDWLMVFGGRGLKTRIRMVEDHSCAVQKD